MLNGVCKMRIEPVGRVCAKVVEASLALVSTEGYMFLEGAIEDTGVDSLVGEVVGVTGAAVPISSCNWGSK